KLIDSAERLLRQVEGKEQITDDPGALLLGALAGEGVTREPAIWVEIQMTGTLRLIPDPETRTAIVSYYLDRASWSKTVEENFIPAVRDLRSLAWDILPVESFSNYFLSLRSGSEADSGVTGTTVMTRLSARDDTTYLLKRFIVTGTVAHVNLKRASEKTAALITQLSRKGHAKGSDSID
ncbi:MAG: hypothetical protein HKN85_12275, partial [Gammaproteobacteria bacterium]|nr:hypothetical protein [Gammaproteobacteria bacterium]